MTIEEKIRIPSKSHLLHEDSEVLTEHRACEKVSKCAHEYTVARRDAGAGEIRLTRHWYTCVNCYAYFNASDMQLTKNEVEQDEDAETPGDAIHLSSGKKDFFEWALQLALPGFEHDREDYIFRTLPDKPECPHCGYIATSTTTQYHDYRIHSTAKSTIVTQIILSSNDYVYSLPYSDTNKKEISFPVFVQLVFEHDSKKTYFALSDINDEFLEEPFEVCSEKALINYIIGDHLSVDTPLRNKLIDIFASLFYDGAIPFDKSDITLDLLILLNTFQSYPGNFYSSIPFAGFTLRVDESFQETSAMLISNNYKDIENIYRHYSLPQKKSIRRIVFSTPALLFFAKELATIPFQNNIDILRSLLSSDSVFAILSKLHSLPGVSLFISDLIEARGEANAWSFVKKNIPYLEYGAALYLLSEPNKRLQMLRQKNAYFYEQFLSGITPTYSLPIPKNKGNIQDCRVGDYYFVSPRNTFDIMQAGIELSNCLARRQYRMNQFFFVKDNNDYVAAIEVFRGEVIEAFRAENAPIKDDKNLFAAFTQWAAMNNFGINKCVFRVGQ